MELFAATARLAVAAAACSSAFSQENFSIGDPFLSWPSKKSQAYFLETQHKLIYLFRSISSSRKKCGKVGQALYFPVFFLHGTWWEKANGFHTCRGRKGYPHIFHVDSTGNGEKCLAEFASADAKKLNHFSGGVYVGKILLGRQCVRRTRAVGRKPYWQKNRKIFRQL